MQGDLLMGTHAIRGISELEFYGTYDIALTPVHRDILEVVNRGNTLYKSLELAGLYVHAGIDMNSNKISELALPTTDYEAAPKKYIDDHNWSAGDITSGIFVAGRIPILPTNRYGSAVLLDGSREMKGDLLMGTHAIRGISELEFYGAYDLALTPSHSDVMDLVNRANTLYKSLELAGLYVHAGIDMNSNKISELGLPITDYEAAPKKYVDDEIAAIGAFSCASLASCDIGDLGTGGVMQGDLLMGTHAIRGISELEFYGAYDIALTPVNTTTLGIRNKADSAYKNLKAKIFYVDDYIDIQNNVIYSPGAIEMRPGDLGNTHHSGFRLYNQIAGETLAFGNLIYHASDNRWNKTDADMISKTEGDIGICLSAASANGYILVFKHGIIKLTSWSFTIGTILYISQTAGGITAVEPSAVGSFSRKIGYAQAADIIYLDPSHTVLENG